MEYMLIWEKRNWSFSVRKAFEKKILPPIALAAAALSLLKSSPETQKRGIAYLNGLTAGENLFNKTSKPVVAVFGGASTPENHPEYLLAEKLGEELAENGFASITGAGPGIMKAVLDGAGPENSLGASIRIETEQEASENLTPENLTEHEDFDSRKISLIERPDAIISLPGSYGSYDEIFQALTLIKTGKIPVKPLVMLSPESQASIFAGILEQVTQDRADKSSMDIEKSVYFTHDPVEAVQYIKNFHSFFKSSTLEKNRLSIKLQGSVDKKAQEEIISYAKEATEGLSGERTPSFDESGETLYIPRTEKILGSEINSLVLGLNKLCAESEVVLSQTKTAQTTKKPKPNGNFLVNTREKAAEVLKTVQEKVTAGR